jgi:hypothetical protein
MHADIASANAKSNAPHLHNTAYNKAEEAHLNMRDFRPNFIHHSFTLSHVHSLGASVSHSFILLIR